MLYFGNAGIAQVNASFVIRCADNFTGWDCLTLCPTHNCTECGLAGHVGDFCQFSPNNCDGVICNVTENSVCVYSAINSSYVCICEPKFTGEDCGTPIDYCVGVSCSGNGACWDMVDGYICTCDDGYTGQLCEVEVDVCEFVTCSGNGMCIKGLCKCDAGFTGVFCENSGL